MVKTHAKYLKLITEKGALLNREEAFEFYTENAMRNEATCKLNNYRPGFHYDDYPMWELEAKASLWHRQTIGSLVIAGNIKICFKGESCN
jgi:hypothetical protein